MVLYFAYDSSKKTWEVSVFQINFIYIGKRGQFQNERGWKTKNKISNENLTS